MGSSPVTATTTPASPQLVSTLRLFFRDVAPLEGGDGLILAFSGGPDSTALSWAASQISAELELRLVAAHLDHGLDPEASQRVLAAQHLSDRLGLDFVYRAVSVTAARRPGESVEAAARRVRYEFLDEVRRDHGARYVATGHHQDDQVETVILRLLYGSGLAGLAAMAQRRRTLVRPFLDLPHRLLAQALEEVDLEPVRDRSNLDLGIPRNLVRHRLIPRLGPSTPKQCLGLAAGAAKVSQTIDRQLQESCPVRRQPWGPVIATAELLRLPGPLRPWALARLHRTAGLGYPPRAAAIEELLRQLEADGAARCDAGSGWRWQSRGRWIGIARAPEPSVDFAYTLKVPGRIELAEISAVMRLTRRSTRPWMWKGSTWRAALDFEVGQRVTVRTRRPGDRVRPLGCDYDRRLKEVLIDRKMPREERGRLPLLCVAGRIAWIPGVTIDDRFRLPSGAGEAWVAELVPSEGK